jgi:hypothetical protein
MLEHDVIIGGKLGVEINTSYELREVWIEKSISKPHNEGNTPLRSVYIYRKVASCGVP